MGAPAAVAVLRHGGDDGTVIIQRRGLAFQFQLRIARFQRLELERKTVLSEIEREKIENPVLEQEDIYQLLSSFKKIDTTSPDGRQLLFNIFVKEVILYNGKVEIFINFRPKKPRKRLIERSNVAQDGSPSQ